jgi:putative holliday junction resolvase
MASGRVLGIDYGTKNIGLAWSDEMGLTVQPLPSWPNRGKRDLAARISRAVSEASVTGIVVGRPLNMSGTESEGSARCERLAEFLRKETGLPVALEDERLSTVEALELWRGMSPRQQRRYRTVDSLAAALILERYLRER